MEKKSYKKCSKCGKLFEHCSKKVGEISSSPIIIKPSTPRVSCEILSNVLTNSIMYQDKDGLLFCRECWKCERVSHKCPDFCCKKGEKIMKVPYIKCVCCGKKRSSGSGVEVIVHQTEDGLVCEECNQKREREKRKNAGSKIRCQCGEKVLLKKEKENKEKGEIR